MQIMINGLDELAVTLAFENGWTVNVSKLPCGHSAITICPSYICENREFGQKFVTDNVKEYGMSAMRKRGDYIDHFDGTDDELIALLVGVRLRPTEKHLAKVGQDIMKAVKS